MGFVDAVKAFYKNYAKFEGRSSRSEYWWPQLFIVIAYVVLLVLSGLLGEKLGIIPALGLMVLGLGSIVPAIAVCVRRLHDVNRSGWFYFIGFIPLVGAIILLVWFCTKGTDGPNQYGPDPFGSVGTTFN